MCLPSGPYGTQGQNHLKVDDIGAGDVIFVDTNVNGSHPQHSFQRDGRPLSVERPVPTGNIGSWAAANVQNIQLPAPFLLVAVFEAADPDSSQSTTRCGNLRPYLSDERRRHADRRDQPD